MEEPKQVGRPRVIKSPAEMDEKVDAYIARCRDKDAPSAITLTGMILALGLSSRESFDEYKNYEGFSDSVKRAKLIIENEYENRLVSGVPAAAPIFALKNFGWKDKTEIANPEGEEFRVFNSVERVIVRK